ncbi:hypothetical protein [Pseudoruegeria sp. SHC-113]|uniref:hypothetical protein n=1 Tax=Pseudoruegeria sp. SHC-113 TaxID=2855439 RepID=UPI0021BB66CE|nr:hypothetical protein [Pseudoruegeria sp. SHC-113]MCT8160316.1 hypothetical protein [Pseudoruegeria sp. SHC-113]
MEGKTSQFLRQLLNQIFCCLCAIEAGAVVVIVGLILSTREAITIKEILDSWLLGQIFILPVFLVSAPFLILLRWVLRVLFRSTRRLCLLTGVAVGLALSFKYATDEWHDWFEWAYIFSVGMMAGFAGGLAWWAVESPILYDDSR